MPILLYAMVDPDQIIMSMSHGYGDGGIELLFH